MPMVTHITLVITLLLSLLVNLAEAATRADQIRQAKASTVLILAINEAGRSVSLGSGFFIDRDGIIRARFEGPVTAAQIEEALRPLLA